MAVTAWKKPGSAKVVSLGGSTWSNPSRITADDNSDATSSISSGGFSDYLLGYNFGFTTSDIPSGSTIDSIDFRFEGLRTAGSGTVSIDVVSLFSNSGGTPSEDGAQGSGAFSPTATLTGSRAVLTAAAIFGSVGLTDTAVRSSGFGLALGFISSGAAGTAGCDYFEARVNYTPGTTDAAGSAAGSGTPSATGRAIKPTSGAASGTGAASGVGHEIHSGAGSAPGTSTAAAIGNPVGAGVGASAGAATELGSGAETVASEGHADGVGTGAGIGESTATAAGSASGQGTPAAVGTGVTPASGSSGGIGSGAAEAEATAAAVGIAAGASTAVAMPPQVIEADGSAAGTAVAEAAGSTVAAADDALGDYHDGKPRSDSAAERERERLRDQKRLRDAVEQAFNRAHGLEDDDEADEPGRPAPVPALVLEFAQELVDLRNIAAGLGEIEAMVAELFARQAAIRQQDEDDAVILLLLAA